MSLPSAQEIYAMAKFLGQLDADGNVPKDKRTRLMALVNEFGVPNLATEHVEPAPPKKMTTAKLLETYWDELRSSGFASEFCATLTRDAATHIVKEHGLTVADPEKEEQAECQTPKLEKK